MLRREMTAAVGGATIDSTSELNDFNVVASVTPTSTASDDGLPSVPNEKLNNLSIDLCTKSCSNNHFYEDVGVIFDTLDVLKNNHCRRVDFLSRLQLTATGITGSSISSRCNALRVTLETVAEHILNTEEEERSADQTNALNLLIRNPPLLYASPSYFLLHLKDIYKVIVLTMAIEDRTNTLWKWQSQLTKRTWLEILLKLDNGCSWARLIEKEITDGDGGGGGGYSNGNDNDNDNDAVFSGFFQVLQTVNVRKLENLLETLQSRNSDGSCDRNRKKMHVQLFLASIDWSTVQIRKIFDLFVANRLKLESDWSPTTFALFGEYLSRLLPQQINELMERRVNASLSAAAYVVNHFETVERVSLPQAKQIVPYLPGDRFFMDRAPNQFLRQLLENFVDDSTPSFAVDESNCTLLAKLLHSQNNLFLSKFYDRTLPMKIIKCLDSNEYSLLQARYILGRSGLRNVNDNLFNLKGLLAAIPASYFANFLETSRPRDFAQLHNHFTHVLKYFPARLNKIAASAAYHACTHLVADSWQCVESVLENDDERMASVISPLDASRYSEKIWQFLVLKANNESEYEVARRTANWPNYLLTQLLRDEQSPLIRYNQLFNRTRPIRFAIMGLNCEILSHVPITDFLPIFRFYNRRRILYDKEFPKDLQKCAQHAFLRHLQIKCNASVDLATRSVNVLRCVDLNDIRSIGGYILATFPVDAILQCAHYERIIEEIGRLSLAELMFSVPKYRLIDIASQYSIKKLVADADINVQLAYLMKLRNLIHFLNETYLENVHPYALKFLLEAKFIDTRICAPTSTRKTWADKLIRAFGSPESWDEDTLLHVADLLIVLNDSSFDALNVSVGYRVADLIKSKYNQLVEWIPQRLPFYKVCSLILEQNEKIAYESTITRLAIFHANIIERQLATVEATQLIDIVVAPQGSASANARSRQAEQSVTYEELVESSPHATDITIVGGNIAEGVANSTFTYDHVQHSYATAKPELQSRTQTTASATAVHSSTTVKQPYDNRDSTTSASDNEYDSLVMNTSTTSTVNEPSSSSNFTSSTGVIDTTTTTTTTTAAAAAAFTSTVAVNLKTDDRIFSSTFGDAQPLVNVVNATLSSSYAPLTYPTSVLGTNTTRTTLSSTSSVVAVIASSSDMANATDMKTTRMSASLVDSVSITESSSVAVTTAASDYRRTGDAASTSTVPVFASDNVPNSTTHLDAEQTGDISVAILLEQVLLEKSKQPNVNNRRLKRQASDDENVIGPTKGINCDALKMLDSMSDLILPFTSAFRSDADYFDCVELLARTDALNAIQKRKILDELSSTLNEEGSEQFVFVAGKSLSAMSAVEWQSLNFSVNSPGTLELIDTIAEISSFDSEQELAFVTMIERHNDAHFNRRTTRPSQPLPFVVAKALGKLLCHLPSNVLNAVLQQYDQALLSDMWRASGRAGHRCPFDCFARIVEFAAHKYGPPQNWEPAIFTLLGPVASALPNVSVHISRYPRYFTNEAFECLSPADSDELRKQSAVVDALPFTAIAHLIAKRAVNGCADTADATAAVVELCSYASTLDHVLLNEEQSSLKQKSPENAPTNKLNFFSTSIITTNVTAATATATAPINTSAATVTGAADILRPRSCYALSISALVFEIIFLSTYLFV